MRARRPAAGAVLGAPTGRPRIRRAFTASARAALPQEQPGEAGLDMGENTARAIPDDRRARPVHLPGVGGTEGGLS